MASPPLRSGPLKCGRARSTARQEVLCAPGSPATLSRARGT
jgi:hypothetical protein